MPNAQDTCDASATATNSGRPASTATSGEVRVAAGRLDGRPWSLWAEKGIDGVGGIENGGLDLAGRWYGMCPGFPNPAEFELIDAGQTGVVYGYAANPGDYVVGLSGSVALPAPATWRIGGGTFFIGTLARPACDYKAITLDAQTKAVTDTHSLGFGSCRPNQLVAITRSAGAW